MIAAPSPRPSHVLCAFALVQAAVVIWAANGLSGDEGIYAFAGLRRLAGHPVDYSGWMNGSPVIWPFLAGIGWKTGGLVGDRLFALGFALVALACTGRVAERTAGRSAAGWAMVFLAIDGTFFSLAHLAVYDLPALAAFSVALVCLVENSRSSRRWWRVAGGVAMAASIVSKYGYVFMLPVAIGLIIAAPGGNRRLFDAAEFALVAGGLVLIHNLCVLGRAIPGSFGAYTAAAPGVGRGLVLLQQLLYGLPFAIAWPALRRLRELRRPDFPVIAALAGGALIWPIFHSFTGIATSANKHAAIGTLCLAPLAGETLRTLGRWRLPAVAALAIWGCGLWLSHEYSWRSFDGAAHYVSEHARPDEAIYHNDGHHRILPYLETAGLDIAHNREPVDTLEKPGPLPSDAVWIIWAEQSDADHKAAVDHGLTRDFVECFVTNTPYFGEYRGDIGVHGSVIRVFRRKASAHSN